MCSPSDSEDDDDYVPPAGQHSGSDSEGISQVERAEAPVTAEERENKQKDRDALWASFQASVASSSKKALENEEAKTMVKIQKKYLFAGEYITEIVEVPEDSTDAKKWPLLQDDQPVNERTQSEASESSSIPLAATAKASLSLPQKPPPKKPGPRKPKTVLGALPSSSTQGAKKLTTLDKSLMDWKAHTGDVSLQDELEANRKGGGYLERVDFLKRVDERKEENLESLKSRKRRKL